jgi:hypothetical protein
VEEAVVRSTICSCAAAASWLLQIWGGKELLLRIDRAVEKKSRTWSKRNSRQVWPQVDPRAHSRETTSRTTELLPSPHERTASLSCFIQCRWRGCFLQIYISTDSTPASVVRALTLGNINSSSGTYSKIGWLNTRNLLRRTNEALDDYKCAICSLGIEETSFHLFFQCPFSSSCWNYLAIQCNLNLPPLDMVIQ